MNDYYTAIIYLSIFSMIVIQLCIKKSNTLTEGRKKVFYWLFNAIIIAAFCEWLGNDLQGRGPSTRLLHIAVKAVELTVAPSIAFYVSWIIEKKREKQIYLYLLAHGVLEILSGFFGFIYYVDENSNYMHMEFYWVYVLAYLISIGYCIFIILRNVKKYQYNGVGFFLLIVVFMITGISIQLYNSEVKVDYLTLAISALMMYVFMLEMIHQTDELTELLNRRGYENYVAHMEEKCVVLFFDVDRFKSINDTYGHAFGDKVLKTIGGNIKKQYSRYGKCFRYGGDEFCVILTQDMEKVEAMNQEFFDKMKLSRKKENHLPEVSIGYAYYNPETQSIQDVVAEADQMMYEKKEERKRKATSKE